MDRFLKSGLIAAALTLGGAATAQQYSAPRDAPEARIPFASSVNGFRAVDDRTIYLNVGRRWYRGTFLSPCREAPWASQIAFDNRRGPGGIDRFSTILVRRERCQLNSLVRIPGEPPKKQKRGGRQERRSD